jgi:hypothetical protein
MASLPFVTSAAQRETIEEFADFIAEFSRATPLADVAALQGYRPEIIHNLLEAMAEWRRCELDNQMAALGGEEVRAHPQLARQFPSDQLPDRPLRKEPPRGASIASLAPTSARKPGAIERHVHVPSFAACGHLTPLRHG